MFRLHIIIMFLLSIGHASISTAQEVSGTVFDDHSLPIPGVSVIVKGSDKGTVTDFNGEYTVAADKGQVLVFSYVGFETQEVGVSNSSHDVTLRVGVALDEIVLVGSRNANRTATETTVPIDVIDIKELGNASPQVNLNQILNFVAPSFSSNTQTISDGTDHIDPASLRGLGPDQVLVLVNGKRRHNSSLVNVNGTFGRGSVGTDLNAIPTASIERIEVLRDGAAAQYGSDAIAGVINIVLNKSVNELNLSVTSGANVSKNANEQTGGVDGETVNVAASYGFPLGEKGGFINLSGDFDYRNDYNRMKKWEGSIFNAYNAIEYQASNAGFDISKLETDMPSIKKYAASVGHFSPKLQSDVQSATSIKDLQAILNTDVTEAELIARGQSREDYNMRVGQSSVKGYRVFTNFSLPLDENNTELYAFAGVSSRKGNSAGFYRLPNQSRTYTPLYINGFLPEIDSKINDQSVSLGLKGKVIGWDVDLSNTFGRNEFLYTVANSSNASLLKASPTTFDAGGFSFLQNTTNLDITKYYEDIFAGFNVAFGGEHRFENYEIIAGDKESYTRYDINGNKIENESNARTDFFGNPRPGGAQVFPGFSTVNELSKNRKSFAGYVDIEADLTEKFLLSAATRYENYSDFGSTINFKVASRYKLTDNINIRTAASTGFRAPSLHQLYYNSTSTIFDNKGNPQEVKTFKNEDQVATDLGIPKLKEETSKSVSLGFTAKIPNANLSVTVDGYFVGIDDRVVYTGQFKGSGTGSFLDKKLKEGNADAGSFFANAIDTESKGLDIVLTHNTDLGANTKLKSDLSATLSHTQKVGKIKASKELEEAGKVNTYFDEESRIYLEEAVPRTKINLSNNLTYKKVNIFLRNVYFGEVTEANNDIRFQQKFGAKVVTDLSLGFKPTDYLTFTIGANNILDIFPDRASKNDFDSSEAGVQNNRSGGRFDWSRRSQQFGIGGRFLFVRLNFEIK